VRFSPGSGQHIVMERGQHHSDGARRIEVCEAATGAVLATFPAGFNPRWLDGDVVIAESPDGSARAELRGDFTVDYIPANRGQLDACNGVMAVSDLVGTTIDGADRFQHYRVDAREPRLSASGALAARRSDGTLRIEFGRDLGPCEDSRWSSETLVWWLGGRVWGRTTPDQATVELTVPGRACALPCPLWAASWGTLLVGLVVDDGELWVSEWADMVAKNGTGWHVGTSAGSGFAWDMRVDGDTLHVAYLDPLGKPVYVAVEIDAPEQSMLKPEPPAPDPERWSFVPDGTLVTGAIELLIGTNPSRQGDIICLHKNTFPECEWRRIVHDPMRDILLHWADASRVPGDPGWWIEPAPMWAQDVFASGDSLKTENAQIIDLRPGVPPNRWRQTNTLYGVKGGGICVQFDPRFPGQYTDMSKQGTDQWAPAGYEKQWTLRDGSSRWMYVVTPLTAKGVVPWGNDSMDIVIQEVESGPQPARDPLPFVPCPRPLSVPPQPEPPKEPEPMPEKPSVRSIPRDQIVAAADAIDTYLMGNPRLGLPDGLLPRETNRATMAQVLDATCAYLIGEWVGFVVDAGPLPGDAEGWKQRREAGLHHTFHVIERERGETQPPVSQPSGPFRGPIGVSGDEFQVPS
jgi:hypothetical protein